MRYLKSVLLVAGKDLRVELRSREQAITLLFFALLVLVVFNFAFGLTVIEFVSLGPGVLWVAFMFSGVLAIGRSFQIEREQERLQGILLSPIDRSAFYLGKVAATVLFMTAVECVIVPVAVVMFNFRFGGRIPLAILALVLNTIGFAGVGTLFAAMTTGTRRSEILLPLLLLPAAGPVALAAVKTTSHILAGRPFRTWAHWLQMSAAYDVIFLAAAVLLFDYALED